MSGDYQLVVHCGETLIRDFTWSILGTPVDLSGYSAILLARIEPYPTSPMIFTWGTGTGEITLSNLGVIHLQVSTSAINPLWGRGGYSQVELLTDNVVKYVLGHYELALTSQGNICTKLLQGRVLITPTVQ